jgi:hypothetical protein
MIKLLRDCFERYGVINSEIFKIKKLNDDTFYKLILEKKITKARRYIIDNNIDYSEIYGLIRKNMLDADIIENKEVRAGLYVTLAEYDFRQAFVSDPELNFAACLFEICKQL